MNFKVGDRVILRKEYSKQPQQHRYGVVVEIELGNPVVSWDDEKHDGTISYYSRALILDPYYDFLDKIKDRLP